MKTDIKSPEEILKEITGIPGFAKVEVLKAMEAYHAQFSDAPKGAEPMSKNEFIDKHQFPFDMTDEEVNMRYLYYKGGFMDGQQSRSFNG